MSWDKGVCPNTKEQRDKNFFLSQDKGTARHGNIFVPRDVSSLGNPSVRPGNLWTKHGIPAIVLLSLHHAAVKFDANSLPAPYQRVCPIKINSFVYLQDLQGGSCIFTPYKEKYVKSKMTKPPKVNMWHPYIHGVPQIIGYKNL